MGYTVTGAAFGEFFVDKGVVGQTVALLAFGDHLMLFLMAFGTEKTPVLGLALGEKFINLGVAGSAELRRGIVGVGNHKGHMGTVTAKTVLENHILEMGGVAGKAFGLKTVTGVTGGTVQGAVDAGIFAELGVLPGMTGETGGGHLPGEGYLQRGVGVAVASKAVFQAKMGRLLAGVVTAAAPGDNVHVPGRMAYMALHAGEFSAVGLPVFIEDDYDMGVALLAVFGGWPQGLSLGLWLGLWLGGGRGLRRQRDAQENAQGYVFYCK